VRALPGNPYDGHTLETVIPEIETPIGASLARIVADRGRATCAGARRSNP
jgi:transposase, IS5 family